MSDKLKLDFDIFYLELKNFTETFKNKSQAVETDKLLSRAGKHGKIDELKAEHLKNVSDLSERFQVEFDERVSKIGRYVRGEKKDAVLDSIKARFSKGESLSGDETNRLLLHEMRENKTIMKKSNFQNMLSGSNVDQLKKTAQTLNDSKDVEKLEWLQEITTLKGEEILSNSLAGQIDGLRTANLDDEQRNLKGVSERIQKETKLFQYSLERSRKGDFVDVRNNDNNEVQ